MDQQEQESQGTQKQGKKGIGGWIFLFVKKGIRRLDSLLTGRGRVKNGNHTGRAKTAQDIRDQWKSRCPWWGP